MTDHALSSTCRRHVGNMSPTCAYVAKSWPTLRVVATQKRPRHTQFISIITDNYKSAQTYRYLSYPNPNPNPNLPPHSSHPQSTLKGMIYNLMRTYYKQNTYKQDYVDTVITMFHYLLTRGWDRYVLKDLILAADDSDGTSTSLQPPSIIWT